MPEPFCCVAAPDPDDFCGTCPSFARIRSNESGTECGRSSEECKRCGDVASWCVDDEEEPTTQAPAAVEVMMDSNVALPAESLRDVEVGTEEEEESGFCCLAAPSAVDVCTFCFRGARIFSHSPCGRSRKSCSSCWVGATWCPVKTKGHKGHLRAGDSPKRSKAPECPATLNVDSYAAGMLPISMVPAGWKSAGGAALVEAVDGHHAIPHLGSRAYFALRCTPGTYEREMYMALDFRGKTLRYSTNVSSVGRGCTASLYFVSMRNDGRKSTCPDSYCDASNVCGASCAEIDVQQANAHSWRAELHTKSDRHRTMEQLGAPSAAGAQEQGKGHGADAYGPGGSCIDTRQPFQVAVAFPVDRWGVLQSVAVTLSQQERTGCQLSMSLGKTGMEELSAAMDAGMTPVISYQSAGDTPWIDGASASAQGDGGGACGESMTFSDFSVESLSVKRMQAHLPRGAHPEPAESKEQRHALEFSRVSLPHASRLEVASKSTWLSTAVGSQQFADDEALRLMEEEEMDQFFCCLVAHDPSNACGSCFPDARADAGSRCSQSEASCQACSRQARWCPVTPSMLRHKGVIPEIAEAVGSKDIFTANVLNFSEPHGVARLMRKFSDARESSGSSGPSRTPEVQPWPTNLLGLLGLALLIAVASATFLLTRQRRRRRQRGGRYGHLESKQVAEGIEVPAA